MIKLETRIFFQSVENIVQVAGIGQGIQEKNFISNFSVLGRGHGMLRSFSTRTFRF